MGFIWLPANRRMDKNSLTALILSTALFTTMAKAESLPPASLRDQQAQQAQQAMNALASQTAGRLGACIVRDGNATCVNGEQRFSMQSVMKLLVAFTAFDAVDAGRVKLEDAITVRRSDLSLYVQPIEKLVGRMGFRTTILDLIERAVIQSDSAATDVLLARLGGPSAVMTALQRKHVSGIRLDRDERHLQTEILGIRWQASFVNPEVLDAAIKAIPAETRTAAYLAYQSDVRDTATPKGMADFLYRLGQGTLLSLRSSDQLIAIMERTVTFPDRLRAGLPPTWRVAHKTGTSGSWQGITVATNDVGLIRNGQDSWMAVVAFVADSPDDSRTRALTIAGVARIAAQ